MKMSVAVLVLSALLCCAAEATGAAAVPQFQVVERQGAEHPDVHFHGFVLTDVFTHHVNTVRSAPDGSKRSLRDELLRPKHTIVRSRLQFKTERSKRLLWSNVATQVGHLDASPTRVCVGLG